MTTPVTSSRARRRIVLAVAVSLASLGAPVALMTATAPEAPTRLAACSTGEEMDVFTTSCTPFLVPNSPSPQGFTTTAANPDIPEIDGVPCTGRDSGACIGLAEDQAAAGPRPEPKVTISSSP